MGIIQSNVTSGYVDLSTTQTIGGLKTFSSGISTAGIIDTGSLTVSTNTDIKGNLNVSGNTIIGDSYTDSLTINTPATFSGMIILTPSIVTGTVTFTSATLQ